MPWRRPKRCSPRRRPRRGRLLTKRAGARTTCDIDTAWSRPASRSSRCTPPPAPPPWPASVPDLFPGEKIPEIVRRELIAERLRSAITHHGSLIIRGFASPTQVTRSVTNIERAFAAYDAIAAEQPAPDLDGWFAPFAHDRVSNRPLKRDAGHDARGRLSPGDVRADRHVRGSRRRPAHARLLRRASGVARGGSGASGVSRTMRTPATGIRTAHSWAPASGRSTSGWGSRTAATPRRESTSSVAGSTASWRPGRAARTSRGASANAVAQAVGLGSIVRPIFDAGDAMIFDHLCLHRTAIDPGMTVDRHAIEAWFLAPSTYGVMLGPGQCGRCAARPDSARVLVGPPSPDLCSVHAHDVARRRARRSSVDLSVAASQRRRGEDRERRAAEHPSHPRRDDRGARAGRRSPRPDPMPRRSISPATKAGSRTGSSIGARPGVLAVDVREKNLQRATVMRDHYEIPPERLEFRRVDVFAVDPEELGTFDVVLLLGLIYHVENPMGVIRLARACARRACASSSLSSTPARPSRSCTVSASPTSCTSRAAASRYNSKAATTRSRRPGRVMSLIPNRVAMQQMAEVAGFGTVEFATPATRSQPAVRPRRPRRVVRLLSGRPSAGSRSRCARYPLPCCAPGPGRRS